MKKVAVLTSRFPFPLERGDKLRIYHQIRQLSQDSDIVLIALSDTEVPKEHIAELEKYAKVYTIYVSFFKKIVNIGLGWLRGLPLSVAFFTDLAAKKEIEKIIAFENPDFIYCQLIRMAEYAKELNTNKIIDYQDAFSKNMARRAKKANFFARILFQHEAKRLAKYEAKAFHFFQHHFIIAENDRDALFFEEKKQIEICQNGIELDFFDEKKFQHVEKKYDLVFVGNMGYHPNIEAAQYLVNEILPLLKKEKTNINVLIAGARPSLAVKNLANENVTVQGWVEDIRMAYSESSIFVAPLFQGSGQQNKVLETMAMGVPCITTSIVNASTGAKPNEEILIADTAQAFSDKIIFLLKEKNEYNKLKINALQFVNQNFSWKKATTPLQLIMNN